MKLLFIMDFFGYGGAQKVFLNLATQLCNMGHTLSMFCYAEESRDHSLDNRIDFIPGKPLLKNRLLRHFVKIFEIRKILKQQEFDLVVVFMTYPSILTLLADVGLSHKIIVSERGDPHVYKGFIKHVGHRVFQRASGAVFQTEGAREFYSNPLYDRSIVIPNPVLENRQDRIPYNQRKAEISFVGRFEMRQKRQDIMVYVFEKIHGEFPDIRLVFYGDGEDLDCVKNLVYSRGLGNYVDFKGSVKDVIHYVRQSRLFVLTSDYEGIPNALIEAMCAGVPCVATDCTPGGARLLIKDGVNGRIVPKGDVDSIAEACIDVLSNVEVGEEYGRRAQEVYDRFEPNEIFSKWNNYIIEVNND